MSIPASTIRLGTRPSPLAMAQANETKLRIEDVWGAHKVAVEIVVIASEGDRDQVTPLSEIGRGIFASALERSLMQGDIDLAVHSAKDLPVASGEDRDASDLQIVGYLPRQDPRDVLCFTDRSQSLATLPPGSRIGTGSARRSAQITAARPDLSIVPIRGNVQTRLERLSTDNLDAVVLAAAGLHRLGLSDFIDEYLSVTSSVPDPGQGAIALQVRREDAIGPRPHNGTQTPLIWGDITCATTTDSVTLERVIASCFGGGCTVPVGVHVDESRAHLFRASSASRPGRVVSVSLHPEDELIPRMEGAARGVVHLVGAGPGDPGLVTTRARDLISSADVLVHDRLIPMELVASAPAGCEVVDAGKSASNHKLTQDQTNALIVDRALQGLTVVRLKGGDPFTFGRGGEEALACRDAGVSFTVVPGVTSGISVPALAGIPVTHRSVSNSVTLVTASAGPDGSRDPNYHWLSATDGTVVLYMGLRRVAHVASQLIAAGAPASRAIAVISQGATTHQQTVAGTLATIGKLVEGVDLPSPGLIVVGDVVGLRSDLTWYESLPLFGRSIVVTRVRAQASELTDMLRELGADVIEAPSIAIESMESPELKDAISRDASEKFNDVIFTSANGVSRMWDALRSQGLDARWFTGVRICSIGTATSAVLRDRGLHADVIASPGRRTAVGMAQTLLESATPMDGRRVLLVRAKTGDNRLPEMLVARGASVSVVPVYRTFAAGLSPDAAPRISDAELVSFASAATVSSFVEACAQESVVMPRRCVSIGPTTSAAARDAGFEIVAEATDPSVAGLIDATRRWATGNEIRSGGVT